ncbi:Zn-ribbon domain-containing OB-fold protein [Luminiphilus syltensis]|uniref:Zn-ribbon domain-containing OB-fold protein n=1 Tax=Luminiphilus syltensis TaxID=1341119 RepID=UPI0002E1F5AA|nr:OB-fold domain-containing protein [Luminiphilus syltensis]
MEKVLPQRVDGVSAPFFEGASDGVLKIQHCADCGHWQFYPRPFCTACGADDPAWEVTRGRGTVASFSIVRRGLTKAYEAPYAVALIDLAEGPRLMSNIIDCDPENITVGAAVEVAFASWSEAITLPVFRLSTEGGTL